MRKISTTILCLFVALFLQAQTTKKLCGQEMLMQHLETRYPGYKAAVDKAFTTAQNHKVNRSGGVYTIPVVFHIVWKDPKENLDDSIIQSQIDVLNEDYSRTNPDAGNTRPVFDSVAGDAMIQFQLKEVIRVQTTNTFSTGFSALPDSLIKETAFGGDDAADPARNLNIWIINIAPSFLGQLLGYAYPPAALANWPVGQEAPKLGWEGVVLDYRTIGRNNPNPLSIQGGGTQVVRGRTATHEIGHYLGLRHIWGDGGIFGPNDCMQSDGIDDTPFANAQSNFDCNTTSNTCTGIETHYNADVPDMIENYMDYSAETCMNLFTRGQADLMRGVLENQRAELPVVNTSITTVKNAIEFSVFPNPSAGIFRLKVAGINDNTKIEVKNFLGETILNTTAVNGTTTLDLREVPNGIYTVEVVASGNRAVKKIVLSK